MTTETVLISDEFLKTFVAFSIGFIASPLIEILKSRLFERGGERAIKRDLVAKLRVALGFFDAFEEQLNSAIGPAIRHGIKMDALQVKSWAVLQSFDLQPVHKLIDQITRLDIRQSSSSGAGQVLTKKLLIALHNLDYVKSFTPVALHTFGLPREENPALQQFTLREGDEAFVKMARDRLLELQQFVVGPYAKKLGIEQLSVIFDIETKKFESEVRELQRIQNEENFRLQLERLREHQEKIE